jgi:hypothetical protein
MVIRPSGLPDRKLAVQVSQNSSNINFERSRNLSKWCNISPLANEPGRLILRDIIDAKVLGNLLFFYWMAARDSPNSQRAGKKAIPLMFAPNRISQGLATAEYGRNRVAWTRNQARTKPSA